MSGPEGRPGATTWAASSGAVPVADTPEVQPRIVRIGGARFNTTAALLLIAAVTVWRTWGVLQWSFRGDDWVLIAQAARTPFFEFVTQQYNGHFMPGAFAIVWLVTWIAPLQYGIAVLPGLLLTFIGGVLFWLLLLELFGNRLANLVPLAIFMLCPLVLRSAFWFIASLMALSLQVAVVGILLVMVRYLRRPSGWRLLGLGVSYLVALLLWEKALLILPLVAMFALLYLGKASGWHRIRSVTLGRWPVWAVLIGATAVYVPAYLAAAGWALGGSSTAALTGQLTATTIGTTVVPSYLGGPWGVNPAAPAALRELSGPGQLITWAVFGVVVGVSLVARRQAWRAWTMLGVYLAMCIALVAAGRLSVLGPVIGLDTRYVADSVPIFALAVALAYMVPLDRRGDPAWADRYLVMEPPAGRSASGPGPPRKRVVRLVPNPDAPLLVLLLVAAYTLSASITTQQTVALADETTTAKTWLGNARSSLAEHPGVAALDTLLPPEALPAALFPEGAKASNALAPIAQGIRWNEPAEQMYTFDANGTLRLAAVREVTVQRAETGCVIAVWGGVDHTTMDPPLLAWVWGIHLTYTADGPSIGAVRVGDSPPQVVHFERGEHELILVHNGPVESVTVHSADSRVCVTEVHAGRIVPA